MPTISALRSNACSGQASGPIGGNSPAPWFDGLAGDRSRIGRTRSRGSMCPEAGYAKKFDRQVPDGSQQPFRGCVALFWHLPKMAGFLGKTEHVGARFLSLRQLRRVGDSRSPVNGKEIQQICPFRACRLASQVAGRATNRATSAAAGRACSAPSPSPAMPDSSTASRPMSRRSRSATSAGASSGSPMLSPCSRTRFPATREAVPCPSSWPR